MTKSLKIAFHSGQDKVKENGEAKENCAANALNQVLGLFQFSSKEQGIDPTQELKIAFTTYATEDEFYNSCCLLRNYDKIFILHSENKDQKAPRNEPWSKSNESSDLKLAFRKKCEFISPDIFEIAGRINSIATDHHRHEEDAFNRIVVAKQIYEEIKLFGHNAEADITNSFLAPARMWLKSGFNGISPTKVYDKLQPRELFDKFQAMFVCILENPVFSLDNPVFSSEFIFDLDSAWKVVKEPEKCSDNDTYIEALDSMMRLLTECRVLADQQPVDANNFRASKTATPILSDDKDAFRVLVIDDHSAYWKPVFEIVNNLLVVQKKPKQVSFEFSVDGENVICAPNNVPHPIGQLLADYDALFLDIHLPGDKNGLKFLNDIRTRNQSLPVIMWTSSVAHELASEAALSNGYIYKKTASCELLAETLSIWLESGRSKRMISLPNPFFDNILKSDDIRKCAFEFTQWCLKYYDGFHALDNNFYRYFNDHGGRHALTLLDYVEKLLRPFLFEDLYVAMDSKFSLFSNDTKKREIEVLWLYVGALCHEIGMFPMRSHSNDGSLKFEQFDDMTEDDILWGRNYHSVRSLLFISKPKYQYDEFRELMKLLRGCDPPGMIGIGKIVVALIAGYHGRILEMGCKSLNNDDKNEPWFCRIDKRFNEKTYNLYNEKKKVFNEIAICLKKHLRNISNAEINGKVLQGRIEKLCALLRFADALEIDKTRIPPHFISCAKKQPQVQIWENLKRFVVDKVEIDRGTVSLHFNAIHPKLKFDNIDSKLTCDNLFDAYYEKNPNGRKNADKENDGIRKRIKKDALKLLNNINNNNDKETIKSMAAFYVTLDIISEYSAIRDLEMTSFIKLGKTYF